MIISITIIFADIELYIYDESPGWLNGAFGIWMWLLILVTQYFIFRLEQDGEITKLEIERVRILEIERMRRERELI